MSNQLQGFGFSLCLVAGLLTAAGTLALVLWRWHGPEAAEPETDEALL